MLQGNDPCHFVKCTVQWLFHPVEKHFVAGIYLMLSFLSNVLSQSLTVHYTTMWFVKNCIFAAKKVLPVLYFNRYCHLKVQYNSRAPLHFYLQVVIKSYYFSTKSYANLSKMYPHSFSLLIKFSSIFRLFPYQLQWQLLFNLLFSLSLLWVKVAGVPFH